MANTKKTNELKIKRKKRVRKKILGTSERPRLSVFRSSRHVYLQIIDDISGVTLASVSSFAKSDKLKRANLEECTKLGKRIAEACKSKNISKVVFDRGIYAYHGRIKAVAEGAREGGLDF